MPVADPGVTQVSANDPSLGQGTVNNSGQPIPYGAPASTPPTPQWAQGQSGVGGGITSLQSSIPLPIPPPPTTQAAPPPMTGPAYMTPAMQQYINAFHTSQAAQGQAMNSALVQSLQGLGQRRDAAAKVAATLPGDAQKLYDQAQAQQQRSSADAASGFAGQTTGGNAGQHLVSIGNAASKHAVDSNQPLLQAGITADYTKGQQTLANTQMANQDQLAQQNQSFQQQLALDAMNRQASQQNAGAQLQNQMALDAFKSSLGTKQYLAEHPQGQAGLSPYQQGQLQLSADSQAKSAGWTSTAGEQHASMKAPTLLQYLQTGVATAGQGQAGAAKAELQSVKDQIVHDPDLLNWFGIHGYVSKDKAGAIVWGI